MTTKTKRLHITYPGNHYPEVDAYIEKCVGVEADGSGFGMGERDMDFTVPDASVEPVRQRLQNLAKIFPGIIVDVYSE